MCVLSFAFVVVSFDVVVLVVVAVVVCLFFVGLIFVLCFNCGCRICLMRWYLCVCCCEPPIRPDSYNNRLYNHISITPTKQRQSSNKNISIL